MKSSLRFFLLSRFLLVTSHALMSVILAQYVFEKTRDPIHLGFLGLSLFLPKFLFSLPAGHYVDSFDRRKILWLSRFFQTIFLTVLLAAIVADLPLAWLYASLCVVGLANCLDGPAQSALLQNLVPAQRLRQAITQAGTAVQIGLLVGPFLFSVLYAWFPDHVILMSVALGLRFFTFVTSLGIRVLYPSQRPAKKTVPAKTWHAVREGLVFIWQQKILLGAMSLDLFAVLFGGAVAMLPFYANDILKVGPTGLGVLRATPYIGATLTGLWLNRFPIQKKFGPVLLACVAVFGLATVCFAVSKVFILSLIFLLILGASDMISVVVRGFLVQEITPDRMRGRVSAVNMVFIGASNELGEVESGFAASFVGVAPSVALGGAMTVLIVLLWRQLFPSLKNLDDIQTRHEIDASTVAANATP